MSVRQLAAINARCSSPLVVVGCCWLLAVVVALALLQFYYAPSGHQRASPMEFNGLGDSSGPKQRPKNPAQLPTVPTSSEQSRQVASPKLLPLRASRVCCSCPLAGESEPVTFGLRAVKSPSSLLLSVRPSVGLVEKFHTQPERQLRDQTHLSSELTQLN